MHQPRARARDLRFARDSCTIVVIVVIIIIVIIVIVMMRDKYTIPIVDLESIIKPVTTTRYMSRLPN